MGNSGKTKLILKNHLSPGDIVMLTAAVRDLHRAFPGRFMTDVRTPCPALWENNPYITPIADDDPEALSIKCEYPAIHRSNEGARHFIWGFMEDLERKLGERGMLGRSEGEQADSWSGEAVEGQSDGSASGISNENLKECFGIDGNGKGTAGGIGSCIQPTEFRGDIYLSEQEKAGTSQVEEITGIAPEVEPYWIIVAGGKWDYTIKWWGAARWQAVADGLRTRFGRRVVQIGETGAGHYHPKLTGGVIDLRGKTDLRQLVRLMYHAEGVVCPVTFAMHLAAAVPAKGSSEREQAGAEASALGSDLLAHARCYNRACVVVAGGREPPHWEAYPTHQFLHTVGTLPCCATGGCWKARTAALGLDDVKDEPKNLCVDVDGVSGLPRCMDKLSPEDVLAAVGRYF